MPQGAGGTDSELSRHHAQQPLSPSRSLPHRIALLRPGLPGTPVSGAAGHELPLHFSLGHLPHTLPTPRPRPRFMRVPQVTSVTLRPERPDGGLLPTASTSPCPASPTA